MKTKWNDNKREWNIRVNDTEFELLAKILYNLNCESEWSKDCTEVQSNLKLSTEEVATLTCMVL